MVIYHCRFHDNLVLCISLSLSRSLALSVVLIVALGPPIYIPIPGDPATDILQAGKLPPVHRLEPGWIDHLEGYLGHWDLARLLVLSLAHDGQYGVGGRFVFTADAGMVRRAVAVVLLILNVGSLDEFIYGVEVRRDL